MKKDKSPKKEFNDLASILPKFDALEAIEQLNASPYSPFNTTTILNQRTVDIAQKMYLDIMKLS